MIHARAAVIALLAAHAVASSSASAAGPAVRFEAVDICVDSADLPLAAYQLEIRVPSEQAIIVGVEGGGHAAFDEPPYYDPAALEGGRIVLAAFSTSKDLPSGRFRIATVHLQEMVPAPRFELHAIVSATRDGAPVPAEVYLHHRRDGESCPEHR